MPGASSWRRSNSASASIDSIASPANGGGWFHSTAGTNAKTAYIANTVNRKSAIGEMNFARSPSMYRRVSLPG